MERPEHPYWHKASQRSGYPEHKKRTRNMRMNLREAMPDTADAVDHLREVFGVDLVNTAIRRGMQGLPHGFHAEENGQAIGTRTKMRGNLVIPVIALPRKESA